jgi:hypothetical protein
MIELRPIKVENGVYTYNFNETELEIMNRALRTLKIQRDISLQCITAKREAAAKEEGKVRGTRRKKENLILLTEPLE